MEFKPLPLSALDSQHPEYQQLASTWRTLDTLRQGYPAIKANLEKYLPKRPVEDDELYKLRTAKFAYSPVMAHVVHTYTGKMAGAGVDFPLNVDPVWQQLRNSNAHPEALKRDEVTLLTEVFTSLLYFGRSHILVDSPVEASNFRSKGELRRSKLTPYFTTVSPLDVISWGDRWVVLKQFETDLEPFAASAVNVVYTFLGDGVCCKYRIPVQLALCSDNEGNSYANVHKVYHKNEWVVPNDDMLWAPEPLVLGAGYDRLVTTEVSEDKWICLALYNKQIQHLRIENAWTDAGYLSGTVQRVFTPSDPTPLEDARVSYDSSTIAKELEKVGNAHILIGKSYEFVESSGTALANLERMLDKIESQIAKIANLSFISGNTTALTQSGLSKRLDMSLLEGTLKEYGNILVDTYNTLLAKAAKLMSVQPVEVGGMSDFTDKDPSELVSLIQVLADIPDFPPLAKMAVYKLLLDNLSLTMSPEERERLDTALSQPPDKVDIRVN